MLVFLESGGRVYRISLHYSCNFSVSLKLCHKKKQEKKEREIKRNLKGSSNLCWFEFAGVEPAGMEGQLYNTILYTGLAYPRILVYSGVLEPYPVENCHRLLFFNLSMEEIPFFSI